jgi:hypothetical protein
VGLAEALMAETKVRRAGALSCLANGDRRALENVREAIMNVFWVEWSVGGGEGRGIGICEFVNLLMTPKSKLNGHWGKFPQASEIADRLSLVR